MNNKLFLSMIILIMAMSSIIIIETSFATEITEQQRDYAYDVLELVNQERTKNGLNKLVMDKELLDAAMKRSNELTQLFNHTRPDGSDWTSIFDGTKGAKNNKGENIAVSFSTPSEVFNSWMKSPGHRANILDPDYNIIGIGYVYNDTAKSYNPNAIGGSKVYEQYDHYWTQLFGFAPTLSKKTVLISTSISTAYYKKSVTIKSIFKDNKGIAIKNTYVTINVNGRNYKVKTNNYGIATLKYSVSNYGNGKLTVKSIFSETNSYYSKYKTTTKTILAPDIKINKIQKIGKYHYMRIKNYGKANARSNYLNIYYGKKQIKKVTIKAIKSGQSIIIKVSLPSKYRNVKKTFNLDYYNYVKESNEKNNKVISK
ncbi:MAG: CAP domain-containing protein [Methanobrevibacter sp.]|jgi:uncharacterized protein YkwD/mRNA-degrading endonuclease HigB of HigAB toxin-antitoxin module|nr:CAP domain-containing protein [Candidatus Methanoflexus mossambicus]